MGEVQSPNILNWYPFKENQKIKEIKKKKHDITKLKQKQISEPTIHSVI